MIKLKLYILNILFSCAILAQNVGSANSFTPLIQPKPKFIKSLGVSVEINGENKNIRISAKNEEEKKASNYLIYLLNSVTENNIEFEIDSNGKKETLWNITFRIIDFDQSFVNNQYYIIESNSNKKTTVISSPSQLGLLYGAVTFSTFIENTKDTVFLHLFNVKDYPSYKNRIANSIPEIGKVEDLFDYALRNKLETIAIAHRVYPWHKVDKDYTKLLTEIKEWKDKFGGPHVMQMQNIYDERYINLASKDDIANLKNVIKTSIEHGVDKLMILADDTPPFEFGKGYVLPHEEEKKKYKHMAEAHVELMWDLKKWLSDNSLQSELYYVPAFYTGEDMHYGDVSLYINTPWEDEAFNPLIEDLNYIGTNMPNDVHVIWTGPYVRSRKIAEEDLNKWVYYLNGRIPFLWDNTIYSHHPFTATPLFTAYHNDFPSDFHLLTGNNGMFVNGNANSEDSKAATITILDYLWDPSNYEPEKSLKIAIERNYGKELVKSLLKFKKTELEMRKIIGERQLWFESDTLWTIIRKARYTHSKSPFYYHYNYTRMKALRLQLKNSVQEPLPKEEFINECILIDNKRKKILEEIKSINEKVYNNIKDISIELPNFEKIQ